MKLIILNHYSDGATYSGTETIPVEAESEEALLCQLEEWAKNAPWCLTWKDTVLKVDTILMKDDYCYMEIMTLDEWWERNVVE